MKAKIDKILIKIVKILTALYVLFHIVIFISNYSSHNFFPLYVILVASRLYFITGHVFGFIISALSIAGLIVAPSRKWLILLVISLLFASGAMAIYIDYLQNPYDYTV